MEDDLTEELTKFIEGEIDAIESLVDMANSLPPAPAESDPKEKTKKSTEDHTQWALAGNGKFIPVGPTVRTIDAGIYEPFVNGSTYGVERMKIESDGIYTLPDMATETVLKEVNKFWSSEPMYRKHKLLYKRGIILHGPPGGGKTVTVKILMNELVRRDGIVLVVQNINLAIVVLKAFRRIEPKRNIIVVLEDIDEIIRFNGEAVVLSFLDGEENVDNVLFLATTNFADRLGARIINRPSRFDRRVFVGMPGADARRVYLERATGDGLDPDSLVQWVADTDEMSIAHLRELVASVYCLEQPYDEVIARLKEMAVQVKSGEEFKSAKVGFNRSPKTSGLFTSGSGQLGK